MRALSGRARAERARHTHRNRGSAPGPTGSFESSLRAGRTILSFFEPFTEYCPDAMRLLRSESLLSPFEARAAACLLAPAAPRAAGRARPCALVACSRSCIPACVARREAGAANEIGCSHTDIVNACSCAYASSRQRERPASSTMPQPSATHNVRGQASGKAAEALRCVASRKSADATPLDTPSREVRPSLRKRRAERDRKCSTHTSQDSR